MLFFLPKKPVFTPNQIERLSNIFDNAGQGVFVVLVISPLVQGVDTRNIWVLLLGAIGVLFFWTVSLILSRRKDFFREERK